MENVFSSWNVSVKDALLEKKMLQYDICLIKITPPPFFFFLPFALPLPYGRPAKMIMKTSPPMIWAF